MTRSPKPVPPEQWKRRERPKAYALRWRDLTAEERSDEMAMLEATRRECRETFAERRAKA